MSTRVRTSNSSRASTKIAIGFVAVLALGYGGYHFWSSRSVGNEVFSPLSPTNVNIVGIDTSMGYRIVVANQIAHLVEGEPQQFEAQTDQGEGGEKTRISIKDMLQAMQGQEAALSRFAMDLNGFREEDLPTVRVHWTVEDLKKAIDGDAALQDKLAADLNVKLDGTPLDVLRPGVIDRGIVIKAPVEVEVPAPEGSRKLTAIMEIPFEARLMKAVFQRIAKKAEIDEATKVGYYQEEALAVLADPTKKENVARSLGFLISDGSLKEKAVLPNKIFANTQVVINSDHIQSAELLERQGPRGPLHNIRLRLSDEGRRRLWKYSRGRVGSQLLLTVNGVAIAAPYISHELAQSELTITQLGLDARMLRENVEVINKEAKG